MTTTLQWIPTSRSAIIAALALLAADLPADEPLPSWNDTAPKKAIVGFVDYDRAAHVGKLDKALDEAVARGWTIVSIKDDWKSIYPARSRD